MAEHSAGLHQINSILKEYWGFENFRSLQEEIILSVLAGKDTLALLPTGGGKSICFQVPALASEGICLVISPLIALMKDQVENLKKKGIPALAIYSGMSFIETKKILLNAIHGNYKFLYISPERLETKLFLEYLPAFNVNLIAVDEAHCVSQWGYDFRPPYLRISNLREQLPAVPILALTASATKIVQDDICRKLLFAEGYQCFQKSFARPNLSYSVFSVASKQHKLLEILKNVKGCGIVYCRTRKHTKEIADLLNMHGLSADFYHAGLGNEERTRKQSSWINNQVKIIVSTNAFGMGIDKPDVRVVVHYDVPDCLENYYQEAGRAGRDEKRAYAVLLYNDRELEDLKLQSDIRYPKQEEIKIVYTALMNYLQVPVYSGEGNNYDFDLAEFSRRFKLNILTATYSIKILEQEDLLSFNEVFFKPSTVVFTSNREELNDFEKSYPELGIVIKGLLRSYEGIFDYPATIYESQLARFIQIDVPGLKKNLEELNNRGIIEYSIQKDKPQLTLLHGRLYNDQVQLNNDSYLNRKQQYELRLTSLIAYTKTTSDCRSQFIAHYFADASAGKCGICDNCINARSNAISKQEFEYISNRIIEILKPNPLSSEEILKIISNSKKDKIWEVINYLIAEKKIVADRDGIIKIL
ncbi:MAG: ATP-dependent DNA helicase RecQ [Ferruginibacter sp.]